MVIKLSIYWLFLLVINWPKMKWCSIRPYLSDVSARVKIKINYFLIDELIIFINYQ
jgi:hypothetical protein